MNFTFKGRPNTGSTIVSSNSSNVPRTNRGAGIQQLQLLVTRLLNGIGYYASRATANTAAAVVIWLVGAWSTGTFLTQIGIEGPTKLYAFILQALLTICEGPIWYKHLRVDRGGAFIIGIGALLFDVVFNIGGLWIYLQNLGNTTFWQAVMAATGQVSAPASLTVFAVACLLGLAIAAGPEALWDL